MKQSIKRGPGDGDSSNDKSPAQLTAFDVQGRRVRRACERCRRKKTKCNGQFPCKRCIDSGAICSAGEKRQVRYKKLPPEYSEVLENNQITLVNTIYKLYNMVRNDMPWSMPEPESNDHGKPTIHSIAQRLGCIRPVTDINSPIQSGLPESIANMAEIGHELDEGQSQISSATDGSNLGLCDLANNATDPLDYFTSHHDEHSMLSNENNGCSFSLYSAPSTDAMGQHSAISEFEVNTFCLDIPLSQAAEQLHNWGTHAFMNAEGTLYHHAQEINELQETEERILLFKGLDMVNFSAT